MTADTYARQQSRYYTGQVHEHDGVWWFSWTPQYCKPVLPYEPVPHPDVRPAPSRSVLGYGMVVPEGHPANDQVHVMVRCAPEPGELYSLKDVEKSKRSQVRKGLTRCEVGRITDLEPWIGDLKDINISTHERTRYGRPASYYTEKYDEWKRGILALFAVEERDWWGAWHEGHLVAFLYGYEVEGVYYIDTFKSNSAAFHASPNDALQYHVMEQALNVRSCREVINSEWAESNPKLNAYKEQFGFVKQTRPMVKHLNPLVRPFLGLAKKLFP